MLDAALSQTREETNTLEMMNDNEGQADAVEARADDVSVEEEGEENQMTDTDIPSTSSKITSSVRAAMKNDGVESPDSSFSSKSRFRIHRRTRTMV